MLAESALLPEQPIKVALRITDKIAGFFMLQVYFLKRRNKQWYFLSLFNFNYLRCIAQFAYNKEVMWGNLCKPIVWAALFGVCFSEAHGAAVDGLAGVEGPSIETAPCSGDCANPATTAEIKACLLPLNLTSFVMVNFSETTDSANPANQVQAPTYTLVGPSPQSPLTFVLPLSSHFGRHETTAFLSCKDNSNEVKGEFKSCVSTASSDPDNLNTLFLAIFRFGLLKHGVHDCTIRFVLVAPNGAQTEYFLPNLRITITGNGIDPSSFIQLKSPSTEGADKSAGVNPPDTTGEDSGPCSLSPHENAHQTQGLIGCFLLLLFLANILRFQQRKQL